MIRKHSLATTTCAAAICLAFATAGAAQDTQRSPANRVSERAVPALAFLERPAERFERSIEVHRLQTRLDSLSARAERLGVEPHRLPSRPAKATGSRRELREQVERLERIVERAERAERAAAEPEYGAVAGVSQATLESIAACESGGDPTAVNPAGYYGKYQFDLGTWASVGGSGNPAEAPEAEQDYRAALLLSRAGASPWPVCGA